MSFAAHPGAITQAKEALVSNACDFYNCALALRLYYSKLGSTVQVSTFAVSLATVCLRLVAAVFSLRISSCCIILES